eukprot:scaffold53404_cov20-Tisochrysis_lutea.AAC.1
MVHCETGLCCKRGLCCKIRVHGSGMQHDLKNGRGPAPLADLFWIRLDPPARPELQRRLRECLGVTPEHILTIMAGNPYYTYYQK